MPPPPPLRPYLALLPLEDAESLAAKLPEDASPLLLRLVRAANPLKSLEQLADDTGIAMPMLYRLAHHLKLWGKVRVIHPLTQESILVVRPEEPPDEPDEYTDLFGDDEPSWEGLLGLFSGGLRFGAVLAAAEGLRIPKRRLVSMTIYLLRTHTLRPLHKFVHCLEEPPDPGEGADEDTAARWHLFRRLRPMFYGEHHFEEITWQERISRDVLTDLLKYYEEYVITITTWEE